MMPAAASYKTPVQPGHAGPHKIDRAVFELRGRVYLAEHDGVSMTFRLVPPAGWSAPATIHRDALREITRLAAPAHSMAGRALRAARAGLVWAPGMDGDYTSQRASSIEEAVSMGHHLAADVLRRAVTPGRYQITDAECSELQSYIDRSEHMQLPDGLDLAAF